MSDRSRDVSNALTEIRTVRSRAQAAVETLAGDLETHRIPAILDEEGYLPPHEEPYRDPDADEMVALLTEFIEKTARFAKAGGHRTAAQRRRGAI